MKELAVRIKAIRSKKGLTQEEMAEKLGMNQSHYAKLENGRIEIKMERLTKIASIFEMKVGDLLVFNETEELEKDALFYYYEWKNAIAEIDRLNKTMLEVEEENDESLDFVRSQRDKFEEKSKDLAKELKSRKEELQKAIDEKDRILNERELLLQEKERTIQMMQKFIDSLLNK